VSAAVTTPVSIPLSPFVPANNRAATNIGSVTALALSHDHTYLACGHSHGHIFLYDLNDPESPARTVVPTSLANVASGRQEGHLLGSRIVSIGFIAGRHTAVVTSDDNGLSFYHSLGKVLFVAANDTLRILGRYPEEDPNEHIRNGKQAEPLIRNPAASRRRRERRMNTTLAMAPLPLGTGPSPTDAYNVVALLTPMKLVIVGLKPSPKTWFRRHRDEDDGRAHRSRWRGTLAWFPSMLSSVPAEAPPSTSRIWKRTPKEEPRSSPAVLIYSWSSTVRLIEVSATTSRQQAKNPKNGKVTELELGSLVFREMTSWEASGDVLALQWLNANVGSFFPVLGISLTLIY
jgi:vacuolar protein sorting-associated protein 8